MTQSDEFSSVRSGVYRAAAEVNRLQSQSQESGLAWSEVDLDAFPGKHAAIEAIASAIGAPAATFGANWDALADVLQDLSWRAASGQVLHLRGRWDANGDDCATLLEVLRASADYWRSRGKPFIVIVDGAAQLPPWT
jgi:Barstar (barnase inhibitor)